MCWERNLIELGEAKEMVNSMEEEKEHVMRGRVRKGEKCVWDLEKQWSESAAMAVVAPIASKKHKECLYVFSDIF